MSDKKHKDYLDDWKKAMACGLIGGRPFSQSTVDVYMLYGQQFLETYGEVSVQNLKKSLLNTPVTQFGKRYKIFQAINCLASYLIEENALDPSYPEQAKAYIPRRHIPPKKVTVNEKEIEALVQACKSPQEKLIVLLLSYTGLRVSEAANLKVSDINMEEGTLTVRLAKWGKTRRVGLTNRLKEALENHLKARKNDSEWLFLSRFGEKMSRYGMRTRLEKLGSLIGIEVTPHALRRAFVTINANKGRPLPMLQIACGHSNITTTRSYCMTTEDETIEAMQGWE
jgi:integrase